MPTARVRRRVRDMRAFLRAGAGRPWTRTVNRGSQGIGQAGTGTSRSRARTSGSRLWPDGSRRTRTAAAGQGVGVADQPAGDGDQPSPQGGDHDLVAAHAAASQNVLTGGDGVMGVSWYSQAAMFAASSAPHIQARLTWGIRWGGATARRRACCRGRCSPPWCGAGASARQRPPCPARTRPGWSG